MKGLITTLMLSLLMPAMGYAASDPMVSLFKFQSQMVEQGNVEAIMKLGEMYEQGQGTRRDLNKAIEMYERAQAQGHPDAVKAIHRIEKIKKQGVRNLEVERKKKLARERAMRKKAMREKVAMDKAMREKAAREEIVREKAAMEKAARDKIAKEKAEREKAAREKVKREKLAKEKAAKVRKQQELEKDQPGMGWDEEDDSEDEDEEDEVEVTGGKPVTTK